MRAAICGFNMCVMMMSLAWIDKVAEAPPTSALFLQQNGLFDCRPFFSALRAKKRASQSQQRFHLFLGGIGFDHTNHQEGAVHLLRTYHVVGVISEVAGQYVGR